AGRVHVPQRRHRRGDSVGTLYSFDWAFPSGAPGESRMGVHATRGGLSSLGYYALVVPPGTAGEVEVNFRGHPDDPEQGGPGRRRPSSRPWETPPFFAEALPPGVSFARLHAFALTEEPPPNPYEEEYPPPDFGFICAPPFGG
ncbi:hypothetical protein ACLESO_58560, partial [Pyxidicoccus sp. 3LG]